MDKKKIKNIIISFLLILISLACIGIIVNFLYKGANTSLDKADEYNEKKLIQIALNNLKNDGEKAKLITDVNTSEDIFVLNFKGLSDRNTNEKILDLLSKSNIKATFFVSAIDAMENSEFIKSLDLQGVKVGSSGLSGNKHVESYSNEDLLKDLVKSNNIIKKLTGKEVDSLILKTTTYTDKLLRLAYESGYENIIHSDHTLNYQSFKNYDQALGYIKSIEKGTIINIKMHGVLDEMEYQPPIKEEKPGIDKEPTISTPIDENIKELKESERLLNAVKWILQAIEEGAYKIDYAENLHSYEKNIEKIEVVESNTGKYGIPFNEYNKSKTNIKQLPNLVALEYYKYSKEELDALREKNNGKKAEEFHTIYTTEKAMNFSFYGISNKETFENTLNKLDELNIKATFFINEKELLTNEQEIICLSQKGHELGIGLIESMGTDYYIILEKTLKMKKKIFDLTGQNPVLFRYPYEFEVSDDVLEAVSTVKGKFMWNDLSVASSIVGKNGNLEDIIKRIFNDGNLFSRRGYVIYSRMDFYSDPNLIANTIDNIVKNRINNLVYQGDNDENSAYYPKTLGAIMDGDRVYNYPLKKEDIIPSIKDKIYLGHLDGVSEAEKFSILKERYIGNPNISSMNTLPGFTEEELGEIDTTGLMTEEKVIFITFDDWSSDKPINHILYVLDKYNVDASFFIRTNYVQNNPNLLRAIAEAGHDIGSHTDEHLPFALTKNEEDEDDSKALYFSITEEDAALRKEDLILSYNKLQSIIGDIAVEGKPVLNRILRPPTLAMSKLGMESIFDAGFSHIISGDLSTGDYQETDPQVLANKIIRGIRKGDGNLRQIQNGSILILHMSDGNKDISDTPNITAKALDIAIPILKSEGYKFARLSDYIQESDVR